MLRPYAYKKGEDTHIFQEEDMVEKVEFALSETSGYEFDVIHIVGPGCLQQKFLRRLQIKPFDAVQRFQFKFD